MNKFIQNKQILFTKLQNLEKKRKKIIINIKNIKEYCSVIK